MSVHYCPTCGRFTMSAVTMLDPFTGRFRFDECGHEATIESQRGTLVAEKKREAGQ